MQNFGAKNKEHYGMLWYFLEWSIEMTSSGRYAYAREILSKKATKIVFTIKRLLSNIDSSAVETRNKLFDALVKPVLLYGCEIWGPELLSYKTHFDKSTIEQVHIKFCKQTLNVPWYTENKACRAELGRYPLSIDIINCDWGFMFYAYKTGKYENKGASLPCRGKSLFSLQKKLHRRRKKLLN